MATTTITTIEDLVRVLDENPEWLEAMRARLLTRELLELPQQLAEFAAATNRRFDRQERDIGPLKGAHARNAALREADLIAEESGLTFIRTLTDADVRDIVQSSDTLGVPVHELRSFRRADLVVEARDPAGEPCWLAVEISFTANGRDTARAMRNAALLERFTGRRAYAAVAGLRHDDRIRDRIEAGEVAWYQLDAHALEVE